jgi:hypothetical protein
MLVEGVTPMPHHGQVHDDDLRSKCGMGSATTSQALARETEQTPSHPFIHYRSCGHMKRCLKQQEITQIRVTTRLDARRFRAH